MEDNVVVLGKGSAAEKRLCPSPLKKADGARIPHNDDDLPNGGLGHWSGQHNQGKEGRIVHIDKTKSQDEDMKDGNDFHADDNNVNVPNTKSKHRSNVVGNNQPLDLREDHRRGLQTESDVQIIDGKGTATTTIDSSSAAGSCNNNFISNTTTNFTSSRGEPMLNGKASPLYDCTPANNAEPDEEKSSSAANGIDESIRHMNSDNNCDRKEVIETIICKEGLDEEIVKGTIDRESETCIKVIDAESVDGPKHNTDETRLTVSGCETRRLCGRNSLDNMDNKSYSVEETTTSADVGHHGVSGETSPIVKRKRGRPRKIESTTSLTSLLGKRTRSARKCNAKKSKRAHDTYVTSQICIGCGDTFDCQAELYEHELTCSSINPISSTNIRDFHYTCPLCDVDCTRKHGLKRHLERKHPKTELFPCTFCQLLVGPIPDYLQHLHRHVKTAASQRKDNVVLEQHSSNSNKSEPSNGDGAHLPESEFICIQCNSSVKNDHSLVDHMLGHKINEALKLNRKDLNDVEALSECNSSSKSNNHNSNSYSNSKTVQQPLNDFTQLLALSDNQSPSLLPESFPSVNAELVLTMNHSVEFVNFILKRLHSELSWSNTSGPKSTADLIGKFNALSAMSSGITEISNCLAQLLLKGQLNENPLSQMSDTQESPVKKEKCEDDEEDDFDIPDVNDDMDGDDCDRNDDEKKGDSDRGLIDTSMMNSIARKVSVRSRKKRGKKTFICKVCGQVLSSSSNYKRHVMIHDNTKPYKCTICSKYFRRNHQLQRHYNVHKVAGKYQCSCCDYSVKTVSLFLKHTADKHHEQVVEEEDDEQEEEDSDFTSLLDHENEDNGNDFVDKNLKENNIDTDAESERSIASENEEEEMDGECSSKDGRQKRKSTISINKEKVEQMKGPYVCSDCGLELAHYSSFMRHKMIHQDKRPFQCDVCSKSFRRKHQLTRHGMVHAKRGNKYQCELCDFFTNTRATLEKHIVDHDSDRLYSCDACEHKTKTVYELTQHKKTHEPRNCKHCDYHAENLSDLRIHERKTHLTLNCSQCDYACFSNWQLHRHAKTHSKESSELFFCELCGFSCNTKRQFNYHMIRHNNRTPFSCPECDYKCSSRSSLSAHKLMHAGLKPFLCSFCGVSFRRSSHLNNHLLIHKDEKQFVCRTCGHPFRTRHNLKVHEMIHTGEKHHKCHLCSFACRRNKELRLHLEKHAASDLTQQMTTENGTPFILPKSELKLEANTLPQELFAAMFQVS